MTVDEIDASTKSENSDTPLKPLTREQLYKLVWSEPMLKVAAQYSVSSSYMARVCTKLNVPRPERGYWAKLAAGQIQPKPSLPEARPGDELIWPWDCNQVPKGRLLPRPPSKSAKKSSNLSAIQHNKHPLIVGAKEHFMAGRFSSDGQYLKPAKQLLVDLVVSKTSIDRALSFANNLFLAFEAIGYPVVIAPKSENFRRAEVDEHEVPRKIPGHNNLWSPWRCTVVYMGTLAIGLTIIELSEEVEVRYVNGKYVRVDLNHTPKRRRSNYDHTWTTHKDYPTGKLCLQAYSPYWRAKWVNHWRETKANELENKINLIVKEIEKSAATVADLVAEGELIAEIERREWEARQKRWRKEEEERRIAKTIKDSREELHQIIEVWAEMNRIENFFRDAEQKTEDMSSDARSKILDRLQRARKLIGTLDALDHFIKWRAPEER